ncbi:site-specific integrase [Paenibacillus sp. FSL M7-0547]|uniref:tyrosine-type recombinase/integrase n=1 Tax=Paenibacillus sp. FSL M7-0547 TaxID=2954755 RepID=UPI0030FBE8CE
MPWVEKRNNGMYRLVVDLEPRSGNEKYVLDSNGKPTKKKKRVRKTKMTQISSKRAADKELLRFVAELLEQNPTMTAPGVGHLKTFREHVERWKEHFVKSDLEQTTQTNYLHHTERRILVQFGDRLLEDDITPYEIIEFIQDLRELKKPDKKVGDATKVYVYRVLQSIFSKAVDWYGIKDNPMDDVPKPKEPETKLLDVYDEKESNIVFKALEQVAMPFKNGSAELFKILITLAFTMGMRRAELLGLGWTHIDLDRMQLTTRYSIPTFKDSKPIIKRPKNKSSIRTISIPMSVVIALKAYKIVWDKMRSDNADLWVNDNYDFLFCHPNGMPIYPKSLSDKWKAFVKKTGIRYIRFHDIRHTSVTILINRGIHAKIISERIGHSKISTTMDVYGHVIRSADVNAAAMFDDVFSSSTDSSATQGGNKGGKVDNTV